MKQRKEKVAASAERVRRLEEERLEKVCRAAQSRSPPPTPVPVENGARLRHAASAPDVRDRPGTDGTRQTQSRSQASPFGVRKRQAKPGPLERLNLSPVRRGIYPSVTDSGKKVMVQHPRRALPSRALSAKRRRRREEREERKRQIVMHRKLQNRPRSAQPDTRLPPEEEVRVAMQRFPPSFRQVEASSPKRRPRSAAQKHVSNLVPRGLEEFDSSESEPEPDLIDDLVADDSTLEVPKKSGEDEDGDSDGMRGRSRGRTSTRASSKRKTKGKRLRRSSSSKTPRRSSVGSRPVSRGSSRYLQASSRPGSGGLRSDRPDTAKSAATSSSGVSKSTSVVAEEQAAAATPSNRGRQKKAPSFIADYIGQRAAASPDYKTPLTQKSKAIEDREKKEAAQKQLQDSFADAVATDVKALERRERRRSRVVADDSVHGGTLAAAGSRDAGRRRSVEQGVVGSLGNIGKALALQPSSTSSHAGGARDEAHDDSAQTKDSTKAEGDPFSAEDHRMADEYGVDISGHDKADDTLARRRRGNAESTAQAFNRVFESIRRFDGKKRAQETELTTLTQQIKRYKRSIEEMRRRRGGVNAVKENEFFVKQRESILLQRILEADASLMAARDHNRKMKEAVDMQRREKVALRRERELLMDEIDNVIESNRYIENEMVFKEHLTEKLRRIARRVKRHAEADVAELAEELIEKDKLAKRDVMSEQWKQVERETEERLERERRMEEERRVLAEKEAKRNWQLVESNTQTIMTEDRVRDLKTCYNTLHDALPNEMAQRIFGPEDLVNEIEALNHEVTALWDQVHRLKEEGKEIRKQAEAQKDWEEVTMGIRRIVPSAPGKAVKVADKSLSLRQQMRARLAAARRGVKVLADKKVQAQKQIDKMVDAVNQVVPWLLTNVECPMLFSSTDGMHTVTQTNLKDAAALLLEIVNSLESGTARPLTRYESQDVRKSFSRERRRSRADDAELVKRMEAHGFTPDAETLQSAAKADLKRTKTASGNAMAAIVAAGKLARLRRKLTRSGSASDLLDSQKQGGAKPAFDPLNRFGAAKKSERRPHTGEPAKRGRKRERRHSIAEQTFAGRGLEDVDSELMKIAPLPDRVAKQVALLEGGNIGGRELFSGSYARRPSSSGPVQPGVLPSSRDGKRRSARPGSTRSRRSSRSGSVAGSRRRPPSRDSPTESEAIESVEAMVASIEAASAAAKGSNTPHPRRKSMSAEANAVTPTAASVVAAAETISGEPASEEMDEEEALEALRAMAEGERVDHKAEMERIAERRLQEGRRTSIAPREIEHVTQDIASRGQGSSLSAEELEHWRNHYDRAEEERSSPQRQKPSKFESARQRRESAISKKLAEFQRGQIETPELATILTPSPGGRARSRRGTRTGSRKGARRRRHSDTHALAESGDLASLLQSDGAGGDALARFGGAPKKKATSPTSDERSAALSQTHTPATIDATHRPARATLHDRRHSDPETLDDLAQLHALGPVEAAAAAARLFAAQQPPSPSSTATKSSSYAATPKAATRTWQQVYDDSSGNFYYFNLKTSEATWEEPDDYLPAEAKASADYGVPPPRPSAPEPAAAKPGAKVSVEVSAPAQTGQQAPGAEATGEPAAADGDDADSYGSGFESEG